MHIRRCIWCCDGGRWKPIFGSRPQRQRYLALDWDVALGKDDGGLDAEQDADVEENKALGVVIAFGVAACEGASDLQDVHGQSYDAMPRYGPCRPPRPAGRQAVFGLLLVLLLLCRGQPWPESFNSNLAGIQG